MHYGLLAMRRRRSPRVWRGVIGCVSLALLFSPTQPASAQDAGKNAAKAKPAAPKPESDDDNAPKDKAAPAPDAKPGAAAADDDDSQATKVIPYEIFRDPKAEKLLNVQNFQQIIKPKVPNNEIQDVKAMADGITPVDAALINRVVDAMVSKLTDHANIQAFVDPPEDLKPNADANRGIQEATTALLEPIFAARRSKNTSFMSLYNRVLQSKLTPLLKNHLVSRVQAMIVLGQSGSTDLFPTYVGQIKEPNQTVWVKLWALEGIVNTIEEGGRLSGEQQSQTGKVIADFLSNAEDLPWPIQLRALEALSALRQGFEASHPERAAMASAAMQLLADGDSQFEVRAEAAKALGLMQITAAVRKYNYPLVAHSIGSLAADLGTQINLLTPERGIKSATQKAAAAPDVAKPTSKTAKGKAKPKFELAPAASAAPPPPPNPIKARYLTSLLIGPVYQAFDGVPGARDTGGLIHGTTGDGASYSQKVFEQVKAVAKASVDLITSGSRQVNDRKKELQARVDALRDLLEKTAPADRHLVQGGQDFPVAQAAAN